MNKRQNRTYDSRPKIPVLNEQICMQMRDNSAVPVFESLADNVVVRELYLAERLNHCRLRFHELCHKYLRLDPPRDCFNNFLLQLQTLNGSSDIIPSSFRQIAPAQCSLLSDLLAAIPMRLRADYTASTDYYLENELRILQSRVNDLLAIEQKQFTSMSAEMQDAFSIYKKEIVRFRIDVIPPHKRAEKLPVAREINLQYAMVRYSSAIQQLIEELCAEMETYGVHTDTSLKDSAFTLQFTDDQTKAVDIELLSQNTQGTTKMYFILLKPDPKSENFAPAMQLFSKLSRNEQKLAVYRIYLYKLLYQYRGKREDFVTALFLLLRRYATFSGSFFAPEGYKPRVFEGSQYYYSLPPRVLQVLAKAGCTTELCSSSLNNYFNTYFSAFPDVEAIFGSSGSIFATSTFENGCFAFLPPSAYFIKAFADLLPQIKTRCVVFTLECDDIDCSQFAASSQQSLQLKATEYYLVSGASYLTSGFYTIGLTPLRMFCFNYAFTEEHLKDIYRHFESPDGIVSALNYPK